MIGIITAVGRRAAAAASASPPRSTSPTAWPLQLIDDGQGHATAGSASRAPTSPPTQAAALGVAGGATVRERRPGRPRRPRPASASDDVITEVDGQPVESMPGLVVALREHEPGDEVEVGYWRDGDTHETTVTRRRAPARRG